MYRSFLGICAILAVAAAPGGLTAQELNLKSWPDDPSLIRVRHETDVTYEMLARRPDAFVNRTIIVKGKVIQALDDGGEHAVIRMNVTPDKDFRFFTDTVWVDYDRYVPNSARILDGDIVEFKGAFTGLKAYRAVSGATIYLPQIRSGNASLFRQPPR